MSEHNISNESERSYIYADGVELLIKNPITLHITDNGSHRVVTELGECYRPTPGYIGIKWTQTDGKYFSF